MAMKLEQSHEPCFRYCSECDKDFIYQEHHFRSSPSHKTEYITTVEGVDSTEHTVCCFTCNTCFLVTINTFHRRHKTYEMMALRVEQSTKPGFRYCSKCYTNFYHPDKDHEGHKTYETFQERFLYHKLLVMKATEDILKKPTVQEHTGKSIETPLQTLKQRAETLIKKYYAGPQFYRIASWNVENLSDNTTRSLLLYEQRVQSVCKTILYYQFDIVALQEVCTETTAKLLVRMLNENSDLIWNVMLNKTHREVSTILHNGYVEAREDTELPKIIARLEYPYQKNPFSCILEISTRKKIVLISTHLTYTDRKKRQNELGQLPDLLSLHNSMSHVILLGDFNTGPVKLNKAMTSTSHKCLFSKGTKTNTIGTKSYDNILVSSEDEELIKYKRVGSIITCKGLTARDVSNHLPIFVDMDIEEC